MSKVSIFPDPSDKYRIVTSSSMPIAPYPGLAVYQTDTKQYLIYDGAQWNEVSGGNDEPTLLYLGKPGILINSLTGLPVYRYRVPSGRTAVITNIRISATLGAAGTTISLGVYDDGTATGHVIAQYMEVPLNGTMSIDTFIPLDSLDGILAGVTLIDAADFTSGEVSVAISGMEY